MSYYIPERTSNAVVVYFSPREFGPEQPPFELQGFISTDTWTTRMAELKRIASRYSKPMFERIWSLVGFMAMVIVPAVAYTLLFQKFVHNNGFNNGFAENNISNANGFFTARAITFGIFVGLALLVYVPIGIWKSRGRRQVAALVQRWQVEDRRLLSGQPTAQWSARLPGVFSNHVVLSAILPFVGPSAFHPAAYLPSYINAPSDGMRNNSTINGVPGVTQPYMGNVPLYSENSDYQMEKAPLVDVKV